MTSARHHRPADTLLSAYREEKKMNDYGPWDD
jgi:hypothetical protein